VDNVGTVKLSFTIATKGMEKMGFEMQKTAYDF